MRSKRYKTQMFFKFFFATTVLILSGCKDKAEALSDKDILSISFPHQVTEPLVNSHLGQVWATVDSTSNLESVKPVIEISEKATIFPASEQEIDFSNGGIKYTVTAEDNSTKEWIVSVEKEKSSKNEILAFSLRREKSPAIIGDSTVTIEVKIGTDISSLEPEIKISPKATISPASEETVDFSNGPATYVVTAEDGDTKDWEVTVKTEKIYKANILSYTVPEQVGETVFEGSYIYVEVPVGYDLTQVVPEITTTEGTTISPKSGEAVDFTVNGYIDYTVTTEIDSKKNWRVFVTEEVIKPTHPYIQYMGRVDFTDSLAPRLYASGTVIKTRFSGTHCQILINDQHRYNSYNNYLEIIVDGEAQRIKTTDKKNTIDFVKNLSDGEHTLMIVKDTEADIGYIELIGFRCDELLMPEPLPDRKIEFIGNSITCGYGNDDSALSCDNGEWYDQHNAYKAYGPIVADKLNAQWMLSSVSGIGMIHSCCDKTFEMPDVYETVNLSVSGKAWDFSNYKADLVTVCLGQNDGIQDSAKFVSAYIGFLNTVRGYYPNAKIICLSSPMADNNLLNAQKSYLSGVVNYFNNQDDNDVYKLIVTNNLTSGCDYHPDMEEHQITANELEVFIKQIMNW